MFSEKDIFSQKDIPVKEPRNLEEYQLMFWQHEGVFLVKTYNRFYNSTRVLRDLNNNLSNDSILSNSLFEFQPAIEEYIRKKISNKLYCKIPLVLYSNKEKGTFPKSKNKELQELIDLLESKKKSSHEEKKSQFFNFK
jgi:hypothetical protein